MLQDSVELWNKWRPIRLKMLRLVGCLFLTFLVPNCRAGLETWPFTVMDKYVDQIEENVLHLKKLSETYKFHEESFDYAKYDEVNALKHAEEFDFIIVGGGTSGAILANRLSEVPEWKILLLEAGTVEDVATQIPRNWQLLENTPHNWGFHTVPQNHTCLGMVDHICHISAGKMLGGSSAINDMVYTRGNHRDYDLWADEGNEGWCFGDVLPYFKRIEDIHFEHFDKKFHHHGGYEHIQHPQHMTFLADHVIQAGHELGLHMVDYNGKFQTGVGIAQLATKFGTRQSSAQAYLEPALKRENLIVKPLSHVLKILISPHTREASGVQYLHEGELFVAKAVKEIILTAGALNTPKILMLSGIGIKEQCEKLQIHPIADLPVGHYLKTRAAFIGLDLIYDEVKFEGVDEYHNLLAYLKHGKGPLTAPGIEALAFVKTNASKNHVEDYPDIELIFSSKLLKSHDHDFKHVHEEQYGAKWKALEGKKIIQIAVVLNHPKSVGHLTLKSKDPFHYPLIEPALLSDPDEHDAEILLEGIDKALRFTHTKAFEKFIPSVKVNPHLVHGCDNHVHTTIDYWRCAIKYLTVPTGDVVGTARMGPEHDKHAVVDKHLRVHGVHKLRVADASVIPVSITGHIMAPVMMIGEKAADLIKEDWKS